MHDDIKGAIDVLDAVLEGNESHAVLNLQLVDHSP